MHNAWTDLHLQHCNHMGSPLVWWKKYDIHKNMKKRNKNIRIFTRKAKPNNELILQTSIICVVKAWFSLFFCAKDLHRPKTIQNTSVSHIVALADMSLHYDEHGHRSRRKYCSTPSNTLLLQLGAESHKQDEEVVKYWRGGLIHCWLCFFFMGFVDYATVRNYPYCLNWTITVF